MMDKLTINQLARLKEALVIGYHYAAQASRKEVNEPPHTPGRRCEDAQKLYDALVFISTTDA